MFVLPYIDFTFFFLLEVCDVLHSSHDVYRIALYFSFFFFFFMRYSSTPEFLCRRLFCYHGLDLWR